MFALNFYSAYTQNDFNLSARSIFSDATHDTVAEKWQNCRKTNFLVAILAHYFQIISNFQ